MVSLVCSCGVTLGDVRPATFPEQVLAHVAGGCPSTAFVMTLRCEACGTLRRMGPGVMRDPDNNRAVLVAAAQDYTWLVQHLACPPPSP